MTAVRGSPPQELLTIAPFDAHLGLELLHCDDERVEARLPVRPELTQPLGMVHGGVYATVAEAVASLGTNRCVAADGKVGLGQSNSCSFLRPVVVGAINATARVRHRGESSHVWDVEMSDDNGRLCAIGRVTVAVRPYRSAAAPRIPPP